MFTINGTNYDIVCDGIIGSDCDPSNSTCNHANHYDCADWVDDRTPRGMKCVAPGYCNNTYSTAGTDYAIVCDGWLGKECELGDASSCNKHMNYTCGDWV